jgi:hypothetical protein
LNESWAIWAWKLIFLYYTLVIVLGAFAMVLRNNQRGSTGQAAQSLYILSTHLGETPLIFSTLFFFALFAFHVRSAREFLTLLITWVVIVPLHLLEQVTVLGKHLQEVWAHRLSSECVGEACARKEPNLILLRRIGEASVGFGQVLTMKHSVQGPLEPAMVIDEFRLAEERWIRCLGVAAQFPPQLENRLRQTVKRSPCLQVRRGCRSSEY